MCVNREKKERWFLSEAVNSCQCAHAEHDSYREHLLPVLWLSVIDSTVQPWVKDGFTESSKNPPHPSPPSPSPSPFGGPNEGDKQVCSYGSLTTTQCKLAHMGRRRHAVESQLLETSQAGHQKLQSAVSAGATADFRETRLPEKPVIHAFQTVREIPIC